MPLSKKKTKTELRLAKRKREKNKRKAEHRALSRKAVRTAKKMGATKRNRRGHRAALTRKRLYGK